MTLWIQDAPDLGGAHLVVDADAWERLTDEQRELLRWGASTVAGGVVWWPDYESKPLARWDETRSGLVPAPNYRVHPSNGGPSTIR